MGKETFLRSFLQKTIFTVFLAVLSTQSAFAKKNSFYLEYPNCRVRLPKAGNDLRPSYFEVLKEKLKYRKFTFKKMPENSRLVIFSLKIKNEAANEKITSI